MILMWKVTLSTKSFVMLQMASLIPENKLARFIENKLSTSTANWARFYSGFVLRSNQSVWTKSFWKTRLGQQIISKGKPSSLFTNVSMT